MKEEALLDILNHLSELIYVADVKTYELLYLDRAGKEAFGVEELNGQKCYEVLQNRKEPCEFCNNAFLKTDEYYTWYFYNPLINKYYLLKDKLIQWDNHLARIEIAFEDTEHQKEVAIENTLSIEKVLVRCISELHRQDDMGNRTQAILEIVAKYMESDRAYIFLVRDEYLDNVYEWCKEGVQHEKDQLQGIAIHEIGNWYTYFKKGQSVVIDDIETLKGEPIYNILKVQDIHNLFISPLISDGEVIGMIGVDNPNQINVKKALPFFKTLSYFLSSSIIKQKNETMLQKMSYSDSLTGLNNRHKYNEDIKEIKKEKEYCLGIIYIDMNGLKSINDSFGHDVGDHSLIQIANVLIQNFDRRNVYRLGGDEFIVFCHNIAIHDFEDKIKILKKYFVQEKCSVSVGYRYVNENDDIQEAIKQADEMMYEDKKDFYRHSFVKRYRYSHDVFSDFMNEDYLIQLIKNQRFTVFFQPKVLISNQSLYGAEALIRYYDEDNELVAPYQFVPLLENHGLIYIIDFYVLDYVCQLLTKWQQDGKQLYPISVNLSRTTLNHPHFIDYLISVFSRYDIDRKYIELEITEDAAYEVMNETLHVIQKLKDLGYCIAIDDFGAKHANIFLFSKIDFDIMKLDKSLIDTLNQNPKILSLVRSLIDICHSLNISIVAEGVETKEMYNTLESLKCDQVQGYLFSRPIPLFEFEKHYIYQDKKKELSFE